MRWQRWVWVGVAAAALGVLGFAPAALAEGEIVPSLASPFTRVTVNDDGFCPLRDERATADSKAFVKSIAMTRGTHALVGSGDIASVDPGRYSVRITCDGGSKTSFDFRVTALPGAPAAGLGGAIERNDGTRVVVGGVLAAAAVGLGVAAVRARRATRGGG